MRVKVGTKYRELRCLWFEGERLVRLIDQTKLPRKLEFFDACSCGDVARAIREMIVRGAPAIGAAAACGLALGAVRGEDLGHCAAMLRATRPTAYDLFFAIEWFLENYAAPEKPTALANRYIEDLVSRCKKIGEHGVALLADGSHVLTHCNAGALATVDWGTALAPLRVAHRRGKRLFVYVSETRPRLQGALTSWELLNEGIAHTLIVDAAAGYYMRKGKVDLVLVGADRIARNGDFANKIGTYEKAVLAKENNVRFYVAAPFSTIDFSLREGAAIRIEERASAEVLGIGRFARGTPAENPAFDVTPAKYVTGYITEDGIFSATELKNLR